MRHNTTEKEGLYSDLWERIPITSRRGNKYIHIIYVYDCNAIITTATKHRSYNEMIRDFTELTEDLKNRGIKPGLHFKENEASTALKKGD